MNERPLRILHTFANFKWTGPADPAIRAAVNLRRLGADVVFAQARWTLPGAEHRMAIELERARVPVTFDLELRKHFAPLSVLRDARRLARRLSRGDFDVVHAHLPADHLVGALAKRAARPRPTCLVRSLYEPHAPGRSWRANLAFRYTDAVVAPTRACAAETVARLGLEPACVLHQEPPTDLQRRRLSGDLRESLGLAREDFVVGITARIQPHRRFDLLWETVSQIVAQRREVRLVLLGRGNEHDTRQLVREPIRARGLEDFVRLPGYLYEPQYSLALRALDVFLFLVPGSDGTCRAVREAMSLGIPVVATARGILPALVGADEATGLGACGILCDEEPAALARAVLELASDAALRARLHVAALAKTDAMDPEPAARRLLELYAFLRERARCS